MFVWQQSDTGVSIQKPCFPLGFIRMRLVPPAPAPLPKLSQWTNSRSVKQNLFKTNKVGLFIYFLNFITINLSDFCLI